MLGLFSFLNKKKILGLDLGASSIKVIAGSMKNNRFQVEELVLVPLPFRAIDEQGIQDMEAVQNAIASALNQVRSPLDVGLAIHGAGVLTKKVLLPKIPKKEIPNQVRWEAEQVFPQDVSTILVDHLVLGEVTNLPNAPKGTKGWELLLVGARQEDVQTFKDLVEAGAGRAKIIDLEAFCLGDFFDKQLPGSKKNYLGLVDVGALATRVTVRHSGRPLYIREFPIGGNTFTEVIAQNLGLSFEDAEALKIQNSGDGFPQEAQEALNSVFGQWKAELQQCEDLFISQEADALVSEWHVFGGASLTPGLLKTLQDERFAERVRSVDVGEHIRASGRSVDTDLLAMWGPRLFTAVSLCCREA